MSEAKRPGKPGRKARTIEEEIEAQQEKLRKLQERKRKQEQRERERNEKAVLALIKREGLNTVPAETWEAALPKLKDLLKRAEDATGATAQPEPETPTGTADANATL